ncbi:MAG: DUF455 family protein [Nannocystaceae bacterium]|nr:ferritin-like domain-containing protein [bacterium]
MEVSAFAERVLVGPTLADKLFEPTELTDEAPLWNGSLPTVPGRSAALPLSHAAGGGAPLQVPDDDRERGALLHAFANHELLATELLALALLRFGEAPAAFRRGLVQTLREEQRHLSLYLVRMRALGVELGERPLSGFFWRAMSQLPTPSAFVAHLSLTFEQANLDFATHYARAFAAMGDRESAAVLQTVLDDEIGHVAFGVRWFERWREDDVPLFDAHKDALRPPLQVVRAKAAGFEVEPRRAAGLSPAYIERLRVCSGSRGRPARVHWFNGAVEQEVEHGLRYTPTKSTQTTISDMETLPLVFASSSDVVLVRRRPRVAFLDALAEAGFTLPRFEVASIERSPWPAPRRVGAIESMQPWGRSPRTHAFCAVANARATDTGAGWNERAAALYDKRTMVRLAASLPADPCWSDARRDARVATHWEGVVSAREDFGSLGHGVRVKPVFGASGRGHVVLRSEADRGAVEALLRKSGAVVVEPELDVVAEFSLRLRVVRERVRVEDIGRCISTPRGQFAHAVIGAADWGLPPEVRRWLRGDGHDPRRLERMASTVAEHIEPEVVAAGVGGPLGVDALLVRVDGALRLRPLVDLNPRRTMGHVASRLRERVARRASAVVSVVTRSDLAAAGFSSFCAWSDALPSAHLEEREGARRLLRGVVPLTDPATAGNVVVVLSAADSLAEAMHPVG